MECHRNGHIWLCVCSSILLVQACMYMACAHMLSCSLCSTKRTETRGVKMFPTKTSRDVRMVDGVSDATGRSKTNWWKKSRNKEVFRDSVTTQSTFAAFKTHFGYIFTIPTSVYWSVFLTSTFSEITRLLMHRRFDIQCGLWPNLRAR